MGCEICVEPANVFVEGGLIVVDAPGGIAFTITPEAAQETAERLEIAVVIATAQKALGTPR